MMTSGTIGVADDSSTQTRESTMEQLRFILQSRTADSQHPDGEALNALVMEVIEDLFDAAVTHDWDDVGAVDIESTDGPWKVAIRLTRDASLREYACARGRARGWR